MMGKLIYGIVGGLIGIACMFCLSQYAINRDFGMSLPEARTLIFECQSILKRDENCAIKIIAVKEGQ